MKIQLVMILGTALSMTPGVPENGHPEENRDWGALRKEICEMRAAIKKNGLDEFLRSKECPASAPFIHTQCWVDWLPKANIEQRAYEQEKRELGRDLLHLLEDMVMSDVSWRDDLVVRSRVKTLLRLKEWLSTVHGCGNYYIQEWAENIALNGIAALVINEKVDMKEIEQLFSRTIDSEENLFFRLDALNSEAPERFTLPLVRVASANRYLMAEWGRRMRGTEEYFREYFKAHPSPGRLPWPAFSFHAVRDADPKYSFYFNDMVSNTVDGEWDRKWHYALCSGGFDRDCRSDVAGMIEYRNIVGSIPLHEANETAGRYDDRLRWIFNGKTGTRETGAPMFAFFVQQGYPLDLYSQKLRCRDPRLRPTWQ